MANSYHLPSGFVAGIVLYTAVNFPSVLITTLPLGPGALPMQASGEKTRKSIPFLDASRHAVGEGSARQWGVIEFLKSPFLDSFM